MNRSVDPCEDFYEFTCGLWVKDHQVKATKVSWYQYKEAEKSITNNLKGMRKIIQHIMKVKT